MGTSSFMSYECTFPYDTPMNEDSALYKTKYMEVNGDRWHVYNDGEGYHSDDYLLDLIDLLCGAQLDKVHGLELESNYQCWEDGEWEHTISIKDGKVKCQETETRWIDSDLDTICANIGQPRIEDAKRAWKMLEDVPVDDDGSILTDVFAFVGYYKAGTDREEIWHDIEDKYKVSVAYLMGEAKNPDGSNE